MRAMVARAGMKRNMTESVRRVQDDLRDLYHHGSCYRCAAEATKTANRLMAGSLSLSNQTLTAMRIRSLSISKSSAQVTLPYGFLESKAM